MQVVQLSSEKVTAAAAIAVFAHNEEAYIKTALESLCPEESSGGLRIYVMANGCTDATAEVVKGCAGALPDLWLVESAVGDKASAWNEFVHDVLTDQLLQGLRQCFFMDGDVWLRPGALKKLAAFLEEKPDLDAVGAMPATGRDRDGWRRRMYENGVLAGNCYALRAEFIEQLRRQAVRMPQGLIGEDFLVSWLVASDDWRLVDGSHDRPRCGFNHLAEFAFRSLSPWSLADWRTHFRRRWRYALRNVQHHMLVLLIREQGIAGMPRDVDELYARAPMPPRPHGPGRPSLWDRAAVRWIRSKRAV
ncbi:MAG: glycosyltransferase family A protein [Pseudomonadota bacterium]